MSVHEKLTTTQYELMLPELSRMFINSPDEVLIEELDHTYEEPDPPSEYELRIELVDSDKSTYSTDSVLIIEYVVDGKTYTWNSERPNTFLNPFWKMVESDERYTRVISSYKPVLRGILVEDQIKNISCVLDYVKHGSTSEICNTKDMNSPYFSENKKLFESIANYFIVDYVGENLLLEIKSVESSFHFGYSWVPLTDTKFFENTSFKINYSQTESGKKIIKNVLFKEYEEELPVRKRKKQLGIEISTPVFHECLVPGEYQYFVIYVMKDGVFVYNVLDDPELVLESDGSITCSYELYYDKYKIPKSKLVPIDNVKILNDYKKLTGL